MIRTVTATFCVLTFIAATTPAAAQVKALWVGQDGKDLVGPSANVAPSDTQDVHIRLENLPADKAIEHIRILRQGGGEWQYKGPWGPYAIVVERAPGATAADLYMEPTHDEAGAQWDITVRYDDQSTAQATLKTGATDTKLRMPDAVLSVQWLGQDGRDWTGRYAAVGPDGIQDVVLKISGMSDKLGVLKAIRIQADGGPTWEYGVNPDRVWNAEVFRDSPAARTAEMLISPPEQSIVGKPLKITIWYGHNRDHTFAGSGVAGESNPTLKTPRPQTYAVHRLSDLRAEWLGQDGRDVTGRGDVHVRVGGLPAAPIVGATLSDSAGGSWNWRAPDSAELYVPPGGEYVEPSRALAFVPAAYESSVADLYFPPFRDERDTRMTLAVRLADGSIHFGQFMGQACDPFMRGKAPVDEAIAAKPGDDLGALAGRYGKIALAPGIYRLDAPLNLERPVTISGPRDAVLLFRQPEGDQPWHGAIYVGADNVTLEGFSLRFDGVVRWAVDDWRLGAAIIRTNEREDRTGDLVNLTVRDMDIQTSALPALEDPAKPHEIPNIIRVGRILSGRIVGNTLRGGTVDVVHGPWVISDNTHLGVPAGGIGWDAFAAHYAHDLTVERNKLHADASPGKLWRFMVLTQYSSNGVVRDNDVRGVGMRDNDPMPNPNAPEIFLTEAYRLHYEGKPVYRSEDGYVLQIPVLMWGAARPGSVVAILDGEHAGQWFRIAQPIDAVTFLMDRPLPAGNYAISVSTGMVDELYENNTIDGRGGASSMMQLCATSFNTVVRNNRILGGGGVLVQCVPTELPGVWGWSHCPMFDFTFENNLLDDTRAGLRLETNHSRIHTKSVPGRLYATAKVTGNTIRWTQAYADWRQAHVSAEQAAKHPLHAIVLGSSEAPGPDDLRVTMRDNVGDIAEALRYAAHILVLNATVDGTATTDRVVELP